MGRGRHVTPEQDAARRQAHEAHDCDRCAGRSLEPPLTGAGFAAWRKLAKLDPKGRRGRLCAKLLHDRRQARQAAREGRQAAQAAVQALQADVRRLEAALAQEKRTTAQLRGTLDRLAREARQAIQAAKLPPVAPQIVQADGARPGPVPLDRAGVPVIALPKLARRPGDRWDGGAAR